MRLYEGTVADFRTSVLENAIADRIGASYERYYKRRVNPSEHRSWQQSLRDFVNLDDAKERILRALRSRFAEVGLRLFDEEFSKRPPEARPGGEKWGGYQIDFKLMEEAKFLKMDGDMDSARREALVSGPSQQRIFSIQMSKHEYCQGKLKRT